MQAARTAATLVLSMAWGYPLEAYIAFVQSLRDTGYSGDLKLLAAGHVHDNVRLFCKSRKAEIVDVPMPRGSIMVQRFGLYMNICTDAYRLCLIADFRDVFFQLDPFMELLQQSVTPDLIFPLEDRRIGTCPFNSYAVRKCYGSPVLRELANRTVICSGVIIGSPAGFRSLAQLMTRSRCPFDKMADQAVLNKLVYSSALPPDINLRYDVRGTGVVNTIGVFKGQPKAGEFKKAHIRHGQVLNNDGTVSACVHQYDRLVKAFSSNGTFGQTKERLLLASLERATLNAGTRAS